MSRSNKLYKDSPSLERDDETGKMAIKKPSKREGEAELGDGEPKGGEKSEDRHDHERRDMHHRHLKEHMDLHHRHELEHSHHEGDKKELHERHEREYKDMHDRHEREMKKLHERHEKEDTAGPDSTRLKAKPEAGDDKGKKEKDPEEVSAKEKK